MQNNEKLIKLFKDIIHSNDEEYVARYLFYSLCKIMQKE